MNFTKEQLDWLKKNGFERDYDIFYENECYCKKMNFYQFEILESGTKLEVKRHNNFRLSQKNIDLLQADLNNYRKLAKEWYKLK